MKFSELNLDENLLKAISAAGFDEATPIQSKTIPLILSGVDVVGQAQTGTGKTAAFALPISQDIDPNSNDIQALVISPTRELAVQTQEEIYRLGKYQGVRVQAVYGGSSIQKQIKQLRNHPQVIVGTPGRLLDHINRHTVKLGNVRTVVLDEADEMLDMGFIEDIESILKNVPSKHQTLLFSATIPKQIMKIAEKFMTDPDIVKIKSKELTADKITQYMVRAKEFEKFNVMTRLFDTQKPKLALIFGRTKRRVDEITRGLKARGYNADGIHGDLSQQKRMSVLRQFKADKLTFLVATDVAARGLDIPNVDYVYNYDIPQDRDSYVHRIGRTGRAGKSGTSVTFVAPNEMSYLRQIEELTKVRMLPLKPPSKEDALIGELDDAKKEVAKQANSKGLEKYAKAAAELLTEYDPEIIAEMLLKSLSKDPEAIPVHITPERPLPSHGSRGRGGHGRGRGHGGRHSNFHGNGHGRNNHRGGGSSRWGHGSRDHRSNDRNRDRRGGGHHDRRRNGDNKKRSFSIRERN